MNDKYGSTKLLAFCAGGIIFNLAVSNIVKQFGSPLYLDTGGTIFISAIGGIAPGITVGFLTNLFASIINNVIRILNDETNAMIILDFTDVYYSTVNVLIAIVTSYLAHRGYYSSFRKVLLTIPATVFITTPVNMLISFVLGFTNETLFLSELETNFVPNFCLETFDKGLMIIAAYFAMKLVPPSVSRSFRSFGRRQATLYR